MRFCPRCGSRYEHERFCPEDGVATEPLPDSGPANDALIGVVVDGRYRVEQQIGEGGMGVVYRATHVSLNKQLALKVLRGEMAKDPEVVQRFIQEAQSATSIGHENIIDINDFGRLPDGTVYFVMEFLNGFALSDMIKRGGSIPLSDAVHIIRQIGGALGAAHQRGIVHRDLKPDNIYLIPRGEIVNFVKVLDFGIAKVGGASNKITRTGMVFGTPHYMSPEQAAGQSVDARTDIYALGVIMYEMFTGHVPFDADTFMAVLTKHMFEKPGPMSQPGDERSLGALEQVTLKALEKKPEHRYQSMQELVDDLERVAGGRRPQLASSPGPAGPSAALADALEPRSRSEMNLHDQVSAANSSSKRFLAIAVGAAVLIAFVVTLFVMRKGEVAEVRVVLEPPLPAALPVAPTPVPPPVAAAANPPTIPESTSRIVVIESDPAGATMVMDGAIVGSTPARFPVPESGTRAIELRYDGYTKEIVRITPDSPSIVHVTLRKRVAVVAAPKPPKPSRPEPVRPSPRRPRIPSEVVDPWAN